MSASPVSWLWYGQDNQGKEHISFGDARQHECQYRYGFTTPQPVEPKPETPKRTADHLRLVDPDEPTE